MRNCINFPIAYIIYFVTFIGVQVATGIVGVTLYSFLVGIPILFIAAFSVAGILQMRDRNPPTPIPTAMAVSLPTSVLETLAMFFPLLIRTNLTHALIIGSLIALSSAVAGLSTFGYAEVVRDQFPTAGARRTDIP